MSIPAKVLRKGLPNRSHEVFARKLAKGMTQSRAYAQMSGLPESDSTSTMGSNWARKPEIAARVAELLDAALPRDTADVEAITQEIDRIGRSDPRELFREDGTIKDPVEWSDDLAASIASFERTEETYFDKDKGRTVTEVKYKVKFWDKNVALTNLAKIHRMLADVQIHQHNNNINVLMISSDMDPAKALELYAMTIGVQAV